MSRCVQLPLLLTLLVLIVGMAPGTSTAAAEQPYIVVLSDSVQAPAVVAEDQVEGHGGKLGFIYRYAIKGYSAELPPAALEELERDPRVKYIVADRQISLLEEEEVELETENNESVEALEATIPTGISRVFAPSNVALDIDGEDDTRAEVDVAVLDTGFVSQPDLRVAGRVDCTKGGSCISNSGAAESHGTHVAGTIGALDNGFGVVGMAPGARLWSVKVLENGKGSWSWVIAGADWVVAHSSEIEVANMSLGGNGIFITLSEALETAMGDGVVIAVAAGNNSFSTSSFTPANIKPLLTVSAIADYDGEPGGKSAPTCVNHGPDDHRAGFSNYGAVDFAAPGVFILSTDLSGGYSLMSGTSMAAPHVAGAAAILAASDNPESTADVEAIQNTLISTGNLNWVDTSGDGVKERLLDVHREDIYSLVAAPTVTTGPGDIRGVGSEAEFVLTGSVIPNGLNTTYQFEYVPASDYEPEAENPYVEGAKAPVSATSIGSGSKGDAIEASQALAGLEPNTTYHYRLVAENSEGTSKGSDRTFLTPAACSGAEGKCSWSTQSTPNPSPETIADFEDVSCPTATRCVAVGSDHYLGTGISRYWNGSEWKSAPSFTNEMKAVSCPTSTWCMAIAKDVAKAWRLSWLEYSSSYSSSLKSPPTPEGATEVKLNDVSCTSESACTVVGRYYAGSYKPYVARWNGSSWSLQTAPGPSEGDASEAMLGVSCSSATHCVSVGKAAKKPFVERWNGSEWATQSAPNPGGASEATLQSISCTSESACMAVGSFKSGSWTSKFLAERWNGTSWSVVASPAPAKEGYAALRSISCLSASSCIAVGGVPAPFVPTAEATVAHAWNGTEWSAQSSLNPETFSSFAGVSCSSATACTAVGQAGPNPGDTSGVGTLAERFN